MPEVAERSTVEILKAARERITPEEAWTTGTYSRSANGSDIRSHSKYATCWCAIGALGWAMRADGCFVDSVGIPAFNFLRLAGRRLFDLNSPATVNDEKGHDAVLAMYDRAIQLAEQEAADA